MGRNICTSGQKSLDDRIIRSKWKMDFDTWITWPFFLASIPFDGKGDEEFLLDERRESHVVFFFLIGEGGVDFCPRESFRR